MKRPTEKVMPEPSLMDIEVGDDLETVINENYSEPLEMIEDENEIFPESDIENEHTPDTEDFNTDEFKEKETITYEEKKSTVESSELIDGALLLGIIDNLLPELAAFFYNQTKKGKKNPVLASKIKMKQSQMKKVAPYIDKVMEQYKVTTNPTFLLIFSVISIYSMNFLNAKLQAEI